METKELIKAFKQGKTGNCVSIAIIKAGIQIFGIDKVFNHLWVDDICEVTMRDGYELSFTREEFIKGEKGSKFQLLNNKEIFDYANLCFTVMAKRAQVEENDDFENMTFEKAIETLNDGEYYRHGPDWIGLQYNILNTKRKHVWKQKGVVGASKKHCFFASEGIEDDYGRIEYIRGFERRFCKWYRVTEKQYF
ncbi:hypothetical protein [Flagellimonas pelagia]|uniref:Uncharacterized protein n=1 Tax=Flagellimonas pelagia TaxID=2306998 RepID=A0A3A1NM76_9FLAO|nr:hypothetical protein [Allomuricauda maritima]RIV47530.1 hypothetical protein D2V05_00055 [Allomuricauda maritima]TXK01619.1 hypothetical protein FQ017_00050 [Allomuricauda maritima]